jgi:hypothetical protein
MNKLVRLSEHRGCIGSTPASYSSSRRIVAILTEMFHGFPQSLVEGVVVILKLDHSRSNLLFTTILLYENTSYIILSIESVVKETENKTSSHSSDYEQFYLLAYNYVVR